MKIIKNFKPPADASPYNPAKHMELGAGESGEMRMNGMGGEMFGINRILPYAKHMDDITISARLNEDYYIFRGLSLRCVYNLFKSIDKLLAPFIIQQNNHIVFELTNNHGENQAVNIQLIGYDQATLSRLQGAYSDIGESIPVPRFLYGRAELPAGAIGDLGVKSKSVDVQARRMAMSSSVDDSVTVSMRIYNTTIRSEMFVEQVNDEFDGLYANVPFMVGSNVPFAVNANNRSGTPANVSFLCEAYVAGSEIQEG